MIDHSTEQLITPAEAAKRLHQTFGPNTAAAMQSWLVLLSGLTNYALAGGISGRSSGGKSFTAERVAELMPPGTVAFASRISVAGLFAMPRVHALVTDELVADEAFRRPGHPSSPQLGQACR